MGPRRESLVQLCTRTSPASSSCASGTSCPRCRKRCATTQRSVGSIFFGGGTPSLLTPEQLSTIVREIPRAPGAEVTAECNPDSVDAAKLDGYADAGVNRLSFGVQSMRPHVLRALGRTHNRDNVATAVDAARRAGFERLNVDLIYGTPGESLDDWRTTLVDALALGPDHVSAYALTCGGSSASRSISRAAGRPTWTMPSAPRAPS